MATQTFLSNPPEAEAKYRGRRVRRAQALRRSLAAVLGSYLFGRAEGNIGTHFNDGIGYTVTNPNQLINAVRAAVARCDPPDQDERLHAHLRGHQSRDFVPRHHRLSVALVRQRDRRRFGGATYFQFIRGTHYPATNAAGQQYREAQVTLPLEPRGTRRVDFRNVAEPPRPRRRLSFRASGAWRVLISTCSTC